MKRVLLIFVMLIFIVGCNNKEEKEKNEYLEMKSKVLEKKKFSSSSDIDFDIVVDIDKKTDEEVSYKVIISNPKEDMRDIKAIIVHNYFNEDKFLTIGIFDKTRTLLKDSGKKIVLSDTIETSDDIKDLELKLKMMIKYTNDKNEKKIIYYKTT